MENSEGPINPVRNTTEQEWLPPISTALKKGVYHTALRLLPGGLFEDPELQQQLSIPENSGLASDYEIGRFMTNTVERVGMVLGTVVPLIDIVTNPRDNGSMTIGALMAGGLAYGVGRVGDALNRRHTIKEIAEQQAENNHNQS
jgi:hypothetical protein